MMQASLMTHEVFSLSPPFEDVDLHAIDRPLADAVAANDGAGCPITMTRAGMSGTVDLEREDVGALLQHALP